MTNERMAELAKTGARTELELLEARAAELRAFLGGEVPNGHGETRAQATEEAPRVEPPKKPAGSTMTKAQRKALSERMKKVWAERRAKKAAQGAAKGSSPEARS